MLSDNHSGIHTSLPIKVGLTGGIGCGKTTVLHAFAQLGVPCFVADEVAAHYYQEEDFLMQVRQLFGDAVFDAAGEVDKRAIAAIVFSDKQKLASLNALVHPRVVRDFECWCARQEAPYVIFESAILYEYGFDRMMDCVVCVYLDKEERLQRLQLRDHASRQQLEARIRNQQSAEEKMMRADYVVLNYEGNPRARQVQYIHKQILDNYLPTQQ